MNPEWKCCVDAFGRQYIYNEKLKCSRWLWERYYDANTKHFYLCNVLTGQSIWEPTTAAVQTPVATSVTMQGRTANPTTTENGNQVAFFTPDGRKYYWDPITKTSQWATTETTTNEGKNQPNTKKDGHRFHHHHAPPVTPSKQPTTDAWRISLAWKPKQPLEKPPQLETTCFKQPKLETRDDISENTILQTCDQNWETGIDTSIHSTTQATGGNQLDKSISKTIVDSKQNVDSNESGLQSNVPLPIKRRKKPKDEKSCLINAVEPLVEKADAGIRIIGTSVALEKPYLRLTSVPDPKDVRPYSVLKKALRHVKNKYKKRKWSYNYTCEQLKSIRQDMTVQGIEDSLAIQVYETHGRLALENNDMDEFIQCVTCLFQLYPKVESEHRIEFVGYRILYATYVDSRELLVSILCELNRHERNLWEVAHAIDVWKAVSVNNWSRFFVLYAKCPHLGFYLMDKMKNRVRQNALNHLRKAFKVDNIQVEFLCKNFGFENADDCIPYFQENGFVLDENKMEIIVSKK